jgi:multisubunit Na+/H+ antiporter MnhB subunit
MGSAANQSAREYILRELKSLGIPASVEQMTAFRQDSAIGYSGARVKNIVARISGYGNSKAVLLSCHYDSVVQGPGASDDGAAVGALLETARALRQTAPLRNDVIFLFTDGEEPVMMGADACVTQSKWIQDVGLAMNFEARGTCGPSLMFETSRPDGALVREFARAAPYPRAASFFRDIYERMPVGTDFTLFKLQGVPGLNFAYIGNSCFYHTSEDNTARMDVRSLQHQGSSALALVRHFGEMTLPLAPAPDALYFNFGNNLVHCSLFWVPMVECALAVSFLFAAWGLHRRGSLNIKKSLLGFGLVLCVCAGAALFGEIYLKLFKWIKPDWFELSFGQVYGNGWLTAGLIAPLTIIVWSTTAFAAHRLGQFGLRAAMTATGIVLSGILCWKCPGASHLGIALLVSGLLLLGLARWPQNEGLAPLAALVAIVPTVAIWIPLMRYLDAGLGIAAWPIQALSCALCVMVMATAAVNFQSIPLRWSLAMAGVLMTVLLGAGIWHGHYSDLQPRPSNAFYALDADTNAAFWVTRQRRLDLWTTAILGPSAKREKFRAISSWLGGEESFWKAPAPVLPLPLPQLELLHAGCTNDTRVFDLKVTSLRGASAILLQFQSDRDTAIIQLDGVEPHEVERQPEVERRSRFVDVRGLPTEGMTVRVRIRGCGKLLARLVERSQDLTAAFSRGVPVLPHDLMTAWEDDYYNRCVMITRLVTFE